MCAYNANEQPVRLPGGLLHFLGRRFLCGRLLQRIGSRRVPVCTTVCRSARKNTMFEQSMTNRNGIIKARILLLFALRILLVSPIFAQAESTAQTIKRIETYGANGIFYADFMRFIDEQTTLIMRSNKSNRDFDRLDFTLAKMIFENNYKPVIPVA
jgi:hypothetical protein